MVNDKKTGIKYPIADYNITPDVAIVDTNLVQSLIQLVKEFRVAMNMPPSLKEFGISEEDFKSNLDKISEGAVADACTGTNPREISVAQMKKLFESVYYGTEVNF